MSFLDSWFTRKKKCEKPTSLLLGKILETMRESVVVVGDDTRILAYNKAAAAAFTRSDTGLENKRLSEIVRDLTLHEAFSRTLEGGKSFDIELEIPGAEKRKYDVHIAPISIGETKAAIGVFYDVTQIERLESVRQEFLSNVSHELRTPLTSILAFVETLEDGAIRDEENNQRFLAVIRKNAQRMHRLIDDILELSSIESGQVRIEPKKVNLNALVEEIFTNLSTKARRRKIKLTNKVAKNTFVFADAVRLDQMLTNLIENAVKFNSEAGNVVVDFERKDAKDTISIFDTGEGISSEHQQRIFERFYRTDRARSREIGGTGLGLAIVKHLARLHGGEVSVVSAPARGTTFSLELPAKTDL